MRIKMEKFKSVWKYVFGVILFPVWWLIILFWCLLLTVFIFVITLKWQLEDIIEGVTLSLDFFGFWKKMEIDARKGVIRAFRGNK